MIRLKPSFKVAPPKFIKRPIGSWLAFKYREDLGFMNTFQSLHGLQLDNDTFSKHQIESMQANGTVAILHDKHFFAFEGYPASQQFDTKGVLVN